MLAALHTDTARQTAGLDAVSRAGREGYAQTPHRDSAAEASSLCISARTDGMLAASS